MVETTAKEKVEILSPDLPDRYHLFRPIGTDKVRSTLRLDCPFSRQGFFGLFLLLIPKPYASVVRASPVGSQSVIPRPLKASAQSLFLLSLGTIII